MWQSRVENVHYSASMKIKFNADNDTSGHCLHGSRSLTLLHVHATSYRSQNTAHFCIAALVIFAASAKIGRKDQDKEWFACLKVTCQLSMRLLSEELRLRTMRGIKALKNMEDI